MVYSKCDAKFNRLVDFAMKSCKISENHTERIK